MRILRVAQKLYPETKGGGAYHVHAMSRDQAAMGHDVTVLTVGEGQRREEREGYTVIRKPVTTQVLGNDISSGLARFLKSTGRFDVAHAHSHLYFSTNLAALNRRLGETPLAITNHGLYSQTAPEWLFYWYLRTLGRWTFDQADVVFCYTEEERARVRKLGVETRIDLVSNGIDTEEFTPEGTVHDLIERNEPAVLFVGRFVRGKRPGDAIRGFERARTRGFNGHLYLAGTGPLKDELRDIVSDRGLGDHVTFLGQVPYAEMPALYRAADVLCLPSRAEGFPRTVLEALSTGTPVVTTELPQLRGVVDEWGVMVPHGDLDKLAAALQELCENDERDATCSRSGRSLVEERFAWSDTVTETTSSLASLVSDV